MPIVTHHLISQISILLTNTRIKKKVQFRHRHLRTVKKKQTIVTEQADIS